MGDESPQCKRERKRKRNSERKRKRKLKRKLEEEARMLQEHRSLFRDFSSDEEVYPVDKHRYRLQAFESCGFDFDHDVIYPSVGIFPLRRTSDNDHIGKVGLHCYNIEKGTNLQFNRLLKVYAESTDLIDFFLTMEVLDPVDNSLHTFQTRVWYVGEKNKARLVLRTIICRIKPQVPDFEDIELFWDFDAIDNFYKGDIPGWLQDDALTGSDKLQFYEVTESDVQENKWLYLYAEAVLYSDRLCDMREFAPIEIKKIVVQTKEDVVCSMKLKSNNAIFYLDFKTDEGEEIRGIVRKTMDGRRGHLSLEAKCVMDGLKPGQDPLRYRRPWFSRQ